MVVFRATQALTRNMPGERQSVSKQHAPRCSYSGLRPWQDRKHSWSSNGKMENMKIRAFHTKLLAFHHFPDFPAPVGKSGVHPSKLSAPRILPNALADLLHPRQDRLRLAQRLDLLVARLLADVEVLQHLSGHPSTSHMAAQEPYLAIYCQSAMFCCRV